MNGLTTEEVQKLIGLLGNIPNIHLPPERMALLAGLPQALLINIPLRGDIANVDISQIVTTLAHEAYFCFDDIYPIVIVIQNAQHKVCRGALYDQLEEFLEEMQRHHNINLVDLPDHPVQQVPSSLPHMSASAFREALDDFLGVIAAYQQGLPGDAAIFKKHVFPRDCQKIHTRLHDVLTYIEKFASMLQMSNNRPPVIIAHGLPLLKEVNIFVKEAKSLVILLHSFCQTYGSALSQPEEQRMVLHQSFNRLAGQCAAMADKAEKLCLQL